MSKSESEQVVSVSARGQATIPKEFRDALGIKTPGRVKFVRTESGDVVVRPIQSVTDLRGILAGQTDGEGRSATEQLRAERQRDKTAETDLRDRYVTEKNDEDE
ncbi:MULTISPECIES: AbrB/MazE/SpoVT family DNA-binding domain-containing protein [unclassified Halonotius]|uniref:AbrB/MazE/SpoVT family DNA-binding domain-containing protein n=1 Tax=unclassified Halonotius TaxID=2638413 RepID=UPI0036182037